MLKQSSSHEGATGAFGSCEGARRASSVEPRESSRLQAIASMLKQSSSHEGATGAFGSCGTARGDNGLELSWGTEFA